jgi:glycosyltransferase involved in cell wall biosynthesis
VVICLANFVAEKQHPTLLRAFAQAKKQVNHLFLLLVGKGELERDVRKLLEQLKLGDSSRIVNDCSNPLPLLCASDAAILTSVIEGCSNALLEAMAMGLPIVASNAGGNSELVRHGRGGIICPVDDVRAFTDAVVCLARDPLLSHRMGLYNIDRVRQEFTDDIMVERTVALYERILSETTQNARDSQPLAGLQARRGQSHVWDSRMAGKSAGR